MAKDPERIKVTPGTDLSDLLAKAGAAPVILERNGVRYRIVREDEGIWAGYDPEKVRTALAKTAGGWAEMDVDRVIADIYKARGEGSRPTTRP
jgi:hypothetical protein